MKQSRSLIVVMLCLVLLACPMTAKAGTFMLGVKSWFTTWESSVLDWFEKDLISDFARAGRTLQTSKDDGSGYLAGPLMSYQTDGGKWSVSFAPMFLSSFSQDWGGSLAGMEMNADLDLERIDYDLAVSYALNKDFWIYFGHKYQEIEIDFVLSYETMMGSITNKYKLESEVHMPTAGAGYVYLVSDKIALSAQLGLLYSVPDLKMTDNDGTVYDIWPRATFGFNSEVTMNYQPLNKVIIQAGYRYQYFRLDARQPDTWNKTESDDITHGLTLSGVWIF